MNRTHDANRRHWDLVAPRWKRMRDRDNLWKQCAQQPELGFVPPAWQLITEYAGPLSGKEVCVLASGDNYAAFALAGSGAKVTSVDISPRQLQIAAERAHSLGLTIHFVQADVIDMAPLPDHSFDLACATNGVLTWLSDLGTYFGEVFRLLRNRGYFIFYDVHPFQRPWQDVTDAVVMAKPYFERGPYAETPRQHEGAPDQTAQVYYNFHWTVGDIINALVAAQFELQQMLEEPADCSQFWQGPSYAGEPNEALLDWKTNPRTGLPVWLMLVARKSRPII